MKMKMDRPCWTIFFVLIWAVIFSAVIILHAALGKTVPAIEDFPENLKKGFYVVLHFEELQSYAEDIKTASDTALDKCGVSAPATACAAVLSDPQNAAGCANGDSMDGSSEKSDIQDSFNAGLTQIQVFATDPIFGTPAMADTSTSISGITSELNNIGTNVACCVAAPAFCGIWESADELYDTYDQVKAEIDKFTEGDAVESFKKGTSYLKYLHVLPWILVLSTIFFLIMWCRNGACCCCSNGSFGHTLLLAVPQAIFWLLSFIIMLIFAAIGWAFAVLVTKEKVSEFNGDPTIEEVLEHFQVKFPEFWDIVFADLEEGLLLFRTSSSIFVVACIIISVYACCFCCCRPYGKGEAKEQESDGV